MNYSTTQANNVAALSGIVVVILSKVFGINILPGEAEELLGTALTLIMLIKQYIHRYRKGDLTVAGFRK